MKRFLPFAFFLFTVVSVAQSPLRVSIVFVGNYRPGQIDARSGEQWFGLYHTSRGFRLVKSKLLVESSSQSNDPYEFSIKVSVEQNSEPLFLVKGIPNFADRQVKTVFAGKFFLPPSQTSILQLIDSIKYGFYAKGSYKDVQGGKALIDYELQFFQFGVKRSQLLATFREVDLDNPPSILWAGDIDNDRKLDFLLEVANHYAASERTLYLSSMAKGNNYVEEVATFRTGE